MAKAATLLFCVGATKASTTWLYKYLAGHPECHLRSIKELHYFDMLDSSLTKARIAALQGDLNEMRVEVGLRPNRRLATKIMDVEAWIPVLQSHDDHAYLGYLTEGIGKSKLAADVTPAYSLLSVDRLRTMAALLPDVRFVYLMRDPVARLWSHVRMAAFRSAGDLEASAVRVFDAVLAGKKPDVMDRGDYRASLARLDAAIHPSRLLVMFQEVLLTLPGIRQLCAFLGISDHPAKFTNRVHVGPNLVMTQDQLLRARAALHPQYEYAASRFGALPDTWLRNMGEGVA